MAISDEKLMELAKKMAEVTLREREKPKLRLVDLPPKREAVDHGIDAITREMHYRRIRYLASAYGLQWLVDQATFSVVNIEDLSDDDLIALHRDIERARECPLEDVSFEDAGLVRNRA